MARFSSLAGELAGRVNRRRSAAGHAAALGVGTVIAGAAAYAYISLGTRTFGAAAFAPVAVVWSLWPVASAAFGLPLEQWTVRELASGAAGEAQVGATLRSTVPAIVALSFAGGVACWAASEQLFGEDGVLYPAVLVALSLGAASMGLLRGGLAGRTRYLAAATATAMENLIRFGAGLAAVAAGLGVRAYAAILVLGPLVGLMWPSAFRFRAGDTRPTSGARDLHGLAGASLLAQVVLAAPPVVLAAMLGPVPAVTASFAALALLRAPYSVAVGASTRALAPLTRALAAGRSREGTWLTRIAVLTAAATAGAALAAPLVMPPVMRLLFGDEAVPGNFAVAAFAGGVAAAHGTLAATVVLLAAGKQAVVLRAWVVACAANAGLLALPLEAEPRVALAFALAELTAVFVMVVSVTSMNARAFGSGGRSAR